MHFIHYAKTLQRSILESAQMDSRIRNYSPLSMSSCGNTGFMGLGAWFPGAMGVPAPGGAAPQAPAGGGQPAPGGMGATAPWGLGAIGLSASGFGGFVRGRGDLAGQTPIQNG